MIVSHKRAATLLEVLFALVILATLTTLGVASFLPVQRQLLLENTTMELVIFLQQAKMRVATQGIALTLPIALQQLGTFAIPKELILSSRSKQIAFTHTDSLARPVTLQLCLRHSAHGNAIILNRLARIRTRAIQCKR